MAINRVAVSACRTKFLAGQVEIEDGARLTRRTFDRAENPSATPLLKPALCNAQNSGYLPHLSVVNCGFRTWVSAAKTACSFHTSIGSVARLHSICHQDTRNARLTCRLSESVNDESDPRS